MSTWIDIRDQDDVEYDINTVSIDILIGSDKFGNNYISVPLEYIINVLKNNNIKIDYE